MPRVRTWCPHCLESFAYSTAFRKHILRAHPFKIPVAQDSDIDDQPLSADDDDGDDMDGRSSDDEYSMDESDTGEYGSDYTADTESIDSGLDGDLSDLEDVDKNPGRASPLAGRTLHPADNPGQSIGIAFDPNEDLQEPHEPFASQRDYRFAEIIVKARGSRRLIKSLVDEPDLIDVEFRSAYEMYKKVDALALGGGWTNWSVGEISYSTGKDGKEVTKPFYYRDPIQCIEFLMKQSYLQDAFVYAPTKEYNEDGERTYSEVHTGDWWWNAQASCFQTI